MLTLEELLLPDELANSQGDSAGAGLSLLLGEQLEDITSGVSISSFHSSAEEELRFCSVFGVLFMSCMLVFVLTGFASGNGKSRLPGGPLAPLYRKARHAGVLVKR